MQIAKELLQSGFAIFPAHAATAAWAADALQRVPSILADAAHAHWWRHGNSWFVGVDALPNEASGRLPEGPPLAGTAIEFIRHHYGFAGPWHRGQLSICYPGYPRRDDTDTEAQHSFRLKRDAAHVDGLHGEGPLKRRHLREQHLFILGLPLNQTPPEAAPLVAWQGSHHIMAAMFEEALSGIPAAEWGDIDLTEPYQKARARVFETCPRVVLHGQPGEAVLLHKYTVHGVSPWPEDKAGECQLRAIAYFRPTEN